MKKIRQLANENYSLEITSRTERYWDEELMKYVTIRSGEFSDIEKLVTFKLEDIWKAQQLQPIEGYKPNEIPIGLLLDTGDSVTYDWLIVCMVLLLMPFTEKLVLSFLAINIQTDLQHFWVCMRDQIPYLGY